MEKVNSHNKNEMVLNLKIAILGGGNIGTQFACLCASKGLQVNIFSSYPEKYDDYLEIVDENNNIIKGSPNLVTDSIEKAVKNCNIIIVTYPAFMLSNTAQLLLPYINSDKSIVVVPGTGGVEFVFSQCIELGASVFGLQRTPSVARLEKYGKRVRCEGLRKNLFYAAFPANSTKRIELLFEYIFDIPCTRLPNYLCVTLVPSNPILHTTRLFSLFKDYKNGVVYKDRKLFYGEWDDESSKLLLSCDEELQQMCHQLSFFDLSSVRSLKSHYESNTVADLTKKISSIQSLHNLSAPMVQVDGGWIPDFNSRYFKADFPYGLDIIRQMAGIVGIDVPNINKTIEWYRNTTGDLAALDIKKYGISSIEDLYRYYSQ